MPKKRNPENKGLPARWKHTHGAYYFNVPPGHEEAWDGKKLYRLGRTLPESYKEWARRVELTDRINTIDKLLDRYALEVVPTKAITTQTQNYIHIKKLRTVFGKMTLSSIKPQSIYKYVDLRRQKKDGRGGFVPARREIATLSHALTKAVEWGYIDRHPFKGEVRLSGEKARTRYVTDEELIAALSLDSQRKKGSIHTIKAYISIKLLTGLRRGDLLRLKISDLGERGIKVKTGKTGKAITYTWSDELKAAVEMAKEARPVDISPWLFCNKYGEGYFDEKTGEANGWNSMWQRFMERVVNETAVTERFTEHDLRAKVGSDAENIERARELLTHANVAITQRVYRRKPEEVKPVR